jgi:hypothetical protein
MRIRVCVRPDFPSKPPQCLYGIVVWLNRVAAIFALIPIEKIVKFSGNLRSFWLRFPLSITMHGVTRPVQTPGIVIKTNEHPIVTTVRLRIRDGMGTDVRCYRCRLYFGCKVAHLGCQFRSRKRNSIRVRPMECSEREPNGIRHSQRFRGHNLRIPFVLRYIKVSRIRAIQRSAPFPVDVPCKCGGS